jgi:hypothetical protein
VDKIADAPILSLLIPTKDRYETLGVVIKEIANNVKDPRLEIVVCDNSLNPDGEKVSWIKRFDARIKYRHSSEKLSMVDNTERGIELCSGEYICFIGDDDLVSPHIISIVEWLKNQESECLIYPPARYWWSGVVFAKESRYQRPGAFWLPWDRDGSVKSHDSVVELDAVLARGGVAYMELPRLYHGIVARRAIDRISNRFGRYVPGSSPDMALSVALALTTESYLSIDYPVTVFGASRNSGGGLTAARRHFGRIEDQRILPRDILDNWDARLPRVWSEQVIYPQTIHEIFLRGGVENRLSYSTLYGSLIAYEPHILRHLLPVVARYIAERPSRIAPVLGKIAIKIAGRVRTSLRHKTGLGMRFDLHDFPSVAGAMQFLKVLPPPLVLSDAAHDAS